MVALAGDRAVGLPLLVGLLLAGILIASGVVNGLQGRLARALGAGKPFGGDVDKRDLLKESDMIEWAGQNGVDKSKFSDAIKSFGVAGKLQRAKCRESYLSGGLELLG